MMQVLGTCAIQVPSFLVYNSENPAFRSTLVAVLYCTAWPLGKRTVIMSHTLCYEQLPLGHHVSLRLALAHEMPAAAARAAVHPHARDRARLAKVLSAAARAELVRVPPLLAAVGDVLGERRGGHSLSAAQ